MIIMNKEVDVKLVFGLLLICLILVSFIITEVKGIGGLIKGDECICNPPITGRGVTLPKILCGEDRFMTIHNEPVLKPNSNMSWCIGLRIGVLIILLLLMGVAFYYWKRKREYINAKEVY
ncbi:hypothetical protein H8D83_01190 [Candidatus Woesearchaeota archaeon]|nr:hypothetical protein [Candidatus Woesearchaeota archaeon]